MGSDNSKQKRFEDRMREKYEKQQQYEEQLRQEQTERSNEEAENRRAREMADATAEMHRREADRAAQQAQNERVEKERFANDLKEERAASDARAERARLLIDQQKKDAEAKMSMQREKNQRVEERAEILRREKQMMEKTMKEREREKEIEVEKAKRKFEMHKEEADTHLKYQQEQTRRAESQVKTFRSEKNQLAQLLKETQLAAGAKEELILTQMSHEAEKSKWEFNLQQIKTNDAEQKAEEYRIEKEIATRRKKEHKKTALAREEDFRKEMQEQKKRSDEKLLTKEEETKKLESERVKLQLEMAKQKGESENKINKKEYELNRTQLEMSNLQQKLDSERTTYDEKIIMKEKDVAEAKDRAELIRAEKDKMGKDHKREIQEQFDFRMQEKQKANDKLTDIQNKHSLELKKEKDSQLSQQIEFRNAMLAQHEEHVKGLEAKNTQNLEFLGNLQMQVFKSQTEQLQMLTMTLQGITGGGPPTAQITSGRSSAQTPTEKEPLVLCNPCIVLIDNLKNAAVLKSIEDDEDILQELFDHIKADVRPVLNGKSIVRSARPCQREDYSENDGIIVFLFSYGNNMTLQDDFRKVEIGRIMEFFIKNPTLVNKPKIFLVQAIKKSGGEEYKEGKLYDGTDHLLCYCEMAEATYMENANEQQGSMFVNSLHEAFKSNAKCDFEEILEIVDESMTENIDADFIFRVESKLNALVQLKIP